MSVILLSLIIASMFGSTAFAETSPPVDPMENQVTQGALRVKIADEVVECPLKHTDVKVNISGFIARATVTQTFYNPYDEKIEAVYVFPLPHTATVDAMTMRVGERKIVGVMKRRAEARTVYEQALQQGQTASLLEQERPNIFTQSVGNIKPRQEIRIEISYVDVLNYDMGTYEFHFPMVVGPRYIPGAPISEKPQVPEELEGKVGKVQERVTKVTLGTDPSGTGWSPDTTVVPDASRITPPVLKPGYRTGHDIRLSVSLDAGVPVQDIEIVNHAAALQRIDTSKATVEISSMDSIPNKDFVLKYRVVGENPEMAIFAHATGPEQRYFMLMIQPKLHAKLLKAPPRELVFLIDVSGSMSGEPIAKVKAAMRHFLQRSTPKDTLQVITFAGQAKRLFEKSVSATEANVARALTFTSQLHGGGGTEMLAGIKAVLNAPVDPKRVRIVVLLTDGYIGNEEEIIAEVGRRAGDAIRFWTIGIGSSPNRFLIDGVAKQGGGMSGVLDLNTNPKELVTRVVERIHRAQLAHIQIDWKQLAVYETYPRRIPELWAGRPVIVFGRYAAGGKTEIALSGRAEGKPLTYTLDVTLPDAEPGHGVLAKVWAGKKIEDLSTQMYFADTPEVVEEITRIALDYRLMSQYTSFVAVDESEMPNISQQVKPPRRVVVPVPLPEGVDFEGIFGQIEEEPQFFYDLFGKELLKGNEVYGYREQKTFDETGQLVVGWTGQLESQRFLAQSEDSFRGRYTEFAIGDGMHLKNSRISKPVQLTNTSANLAPTLGRRNGLNEDPGVRHSVVGFQVNRYEKRQEDAQAAITEAQALQKQGHLESARLRYQHALGLAADDNGIRGTAIEAIWTLGNEIAKKRAKVYPGLNRKLDLILRNQPLVDAIRTLVNAGGFQLDLVPGSIDDVTRLLDVTEPRVPYLDLRHATVVQGLEWLLAPYHLTWRIKTPDTIMVGTARRMPRHSVWGYDVLALTMPLKSEFDEGAPSKSAESALKDFLNAIRIVINQKEEGIQPSSAMLLDAKRLLIYGGPEIHQKVERILKALRDGKSDVTRIAGRKLSKDEYAALKVLQKLTRNRWKERRKIVAEARTIRGATQKRRWIVAESWHLLAEALNGEVDLEALTKLQVAWEDRQILSIIGGKYLPLAMRSAWCIRTAARAVPTDEELATFSKSVLSKVREIKVLKPQDSFTAYLGSVYAVLAHDENPHEARKVLMKKAKGTARFITKGLLSPSKESDKALQVMLSSHQINDEDLILLTCLVAKRRGGDLWQTFREKLPSMVRQSRMSGPVLIVVNRFAASQLIW